MWSVILRDVEAQYKCAMHVDQCGINLVIGKNSSTHEIIEGNIQATYSPHNFTATPIE